MLFYEINPGLRIKLLEKRHAKSFFEFIEKGRTHFENWIPFVSNTTSIEFVETKIDAYLEMLRKGTGYFWCVWDSERIISLILIKEINREAKSAEIGYMIDKDYEGKGIIKASCELMIDFIFSELEFQKVILCCDEENERSIGVAKHFGFELEGVIKQDIVINGKIRNTMHWGLFKENYLST